MLRYVDRGTRLAPLLALGATVAMLLTACGNSGSSSNAANIGKPVHGGAITIGVDAAPAGFDPAIDSIPSPGADSIARSIFETLVVPGNVSGYKLYDAKSMTHNANATVWTITLRSGIRFSDGTPLNAAAVQYDFERVNKIGFAGNQTWPSLKTVEVVNNLTVRVILKYPDGAFPVELYSQLGTLGSPTAYRKEGTAFASHPVGSGPYELQTWISGNKAVLVRNPYYWRKPYPYFSKVTFLVIPNQESSLAALEAHTVDAAEINPADIPTARKDGFSIRQGTFGTTDLALNSSAPPLNDLAVRRAIEMAINKKAVVQTAFSGVGPVTDTLAPPGNPFYTKVNGQGYDPSEAAALVKQYKAKTGHVPTFQIAEANDPQDELFAQVVQQELDSVGMKVTISQPQDPNAHDLELLALKYQAATDAIPEGLDPGLWWPIIFASKSDGGIENFYGYSNPTIDKAINIAHETTNLALEKREYAIVEQQVAANYYTIPIRGVIYAEAYAPDIHGEGDWKLPDGTVQQWGQDYRVPFIVESLWRSS
jgi:peptide/nickel transport system substrate-binding protein